MKNYKNMPKSFLIDSLPESAANHRSGSAVVAVDVIRATTLAVTAVALGRRCFPGQVHLHPAADPEVGDAFPA